MRTMKLSASVGAILLSGIIVAFSQQPREAAEKAQLDFLKKHWQLPVPPQG